MLLVEQGWSLLNKTSPQMAVSVWYVRPHKDITPVGGFGSGQSIVCFCQAASTTTEHLLHAYSLHATTTEHLLQHIHHTRQQQNICCSILTTRDNNGTSAAAYSPHASTAEHLLQHTQNTRQQRNTCCSILTTRVNNRTPAACIPTTRDNSRKSAAYILTTSDNNGTSAAAYTLHATTTEHLLHAYLLHATTNIVRAIRRTGRKLYSGSEKLRKVCSGNIRQVRRTLSLTGWEQRALLWMRKNKNGWRCRYRYFTRLEGNLFICWLVGGAALSRGPRMR